MNKIFKTVTLMAMLFISVASFAIPANPTPVTIKQANGKTLTFILQGDEYVNWAKTTDGYTILKNNEGMYVYATKDSRDNLIPSSYIAANTNERSSEDIAFLSTTRTDLRYSSNQVSSMKNAWIQKNGTIHTKYTTTGTVKLLVILVSFSDLPFTYTNQNFQDLVKQHNYNNYGSVKDFYLQNSDSIFTMDIDVVGPFTLPNTMAYYGGNSSSMGSQYFVRDAINAADASVNFANYDNDGDGYVDAIHIIFAGTPESSTGNANEIWPHRGSVRQYMQYTPKDGKYFDVYSCSAEKKYEYGQTSMDGIGTVCHEFGHVLGFPDYYDTDYAGNGGTSNTLASWDLMDAGSYNNHSNTPPALSAAERTITGWMTPTKLTTTRDSILLPVLTDSTVAYQVDLSDTNEYFLIEHRKKKGWDAFLPGNGMMIYHGNKSKINAWLVNHDNTINVNPSNRGWFIEVADGNESHFETAYAPFPGSSNIHNFTNTSANNATLNNGTPANKPITNIHYVNDSLIMFNFMSNTPYVETSTIVNGSLTTSSFAATGKITYIPSSNLTQKGIYYSTSTDCDIATATMILDTTLSNDSTISATITGLTPATNYYYRAFASTSGGTHYGDVKSTTTNNGLGYVMTNSSSNVDSSSATLTGNLYFIGEGSFIKKGFVYTTIADHTPVIDIDNVVISLDSTLGSYSLPLTGLTEGTTYYYRAFIQNSFGTRYGNKYSFHTTAPAILNNTISANQAVCLGTAPNQLNGTLPTGGRGNFTYLWQQKSRTSQWIAATQTNNNQNYQPEAITDSTFYRRIVISNGTIQDTSNSILIDVRISRGGNLTFTNDTVNQNTIGKFTLTDYRGTLSWERTGNNNTNYADLGNSTATYNATFSDLGTYTYRVKVQIDQCAPAYSNEKKVVVVNNSSIEDITNNIDFSIMPNPTNNGIFTINSSLNNANKITISNIMGQRVYFETNANLKDKTISIPNAKNGAYIITVENNGKQLSKKIIVNK